MPRWKRLTIVALGINTGAVPITLVDPFVANILGILSLGFFTVSSGYMAFGYRDLIAAQALTAEIEPDPRFPYMASLIAAGFGMGAMTAVGFAFESEAAAIIGAVCTVVSGVSGIIAVVRTSAYSRAIDYPSYTRQMQGTSQSNRFHSTGLPGTERREAAIGPERTAGALQLLTSLGGAALAGQRSMAGHETEGRWILRTCCRLTNGSSPPGGAVTQPTR